jgi:hypothetical protein
MLKIENLTSDPLQKQTVVLPDGSRVSIRLYYRPNQYGWFFDEISWNTFLLRGLRVTNSPNLLHQWKNGIGFGIACFTKGNREPTQANDFSSDAASLYVLTADEVLEYDAVLQEE